VLGSPGPGWVLPAGVFGVCQITVPPTGTGPDPDPGTGIRGLGGGMQGTLMPAVSPGLGLWNQQDYMPMPWGHVEVPMYSEFCKENNCSASRTSR